MASRKTPLFLQKYLQAQLLFHSTVREAREQDVKNKNWNSLCWRKRNHFVSKLALAGNFSLGKLLKWAVLSILPGFKEAAYYLQSPGGWFGFHSSPEQWKQWELSRTGSGVQVKRQWLPVSLLCEKQIPMFAGPSKTTGAACLCE